MKTLIAILLTALALPVMAGETLVDVDAEKPDDGFDVQSGPRMAVTEGDFIWIIFQEDVGGRATMAYMDGIGGSFTTIDNFGNDGDSKYSHLWPIGDTLYAALGSVAADSQFVYKFFNGSEVCADNIWPPTGTGEVSNYYVAAWGDGDSWLAQGKLGTTLGVVRTLADGEICSATEWAGTSTFTIAATDQEDFIFAPSESGVLVFNMDAEEMNFWEANGDMNAQVIDPCFAHVHMPQRDDGDAYADIGSCPGSLDGANDTTYWVIVDDASLHFQVYTVVSDASAGTASIVDSSGVISTGPKPTNHLTDWHVAVNPHIILGGDGMIVIGKDWADTASWEVPRAAYYVIDDRSDLTQSWTKYVVEPVDGEIGVLSAPWDLVVHAHADSSVLVYAWTSEAGAQAYSRLMMTDVTIETPSAGAPAAHTFEGRIVPVTIQ